MGYIIFFNSYMVGNKKVYNTLNYVRRKHYE
nr:MAG TPA: hypothetical protein [Caudoviricetes sp.]DAX22488.1 MAG TPA: hypothetical protein [Bacteriophage sp.]